MMETSDLKEFREILRLEEMMDMYRMMVTIRKFEDKVQEVFAKGLVYGTTHLCKGQEAVSAGAMKALGALDYLTYTYRGHGQCLARGMDPEKMFAELFGRAGGICEGKGGSMHMMDKNLGLITSAAIVGAGLPVAVGAGLACKLGKREAIAVSFFGEGSTNIGVFHESMNLASIWKLPVLFLCENNLYGEYSRINQTTPVSDIAERGSAYRMRSVIVDGNNVFAVLKVVREAREYALAHSAPTLIECKTYRTCGHSRTDPAKYRPDGELDHWLEKDPIVYMKKELEENGLCTTEALEEVERQVSETIRRAAANAEAYDWPDVETSGQAVYKN